MCSRLIGDGSYFGAKPSALFRVICSSALTYREAGTVSLRVRALCPSVPLTSASSQELRAPWCATVTPSSHSFRLSLGCKLSGMKEHLLHICVQLLCEVTFLWYPELEQPLQIMCIRPGMTNRDGTGLLQSLAIVQQLTQAGYAMPESFPDEEPWNSHGKGRHSLGEGFEQLQVQGKQLQR